MAEKDTIFSSSIKSSGIFSFQDFYNFCYDWLTEESGLSISENKYAEKLSGDSKNIDIEWVGTKVVTDYFRFEIKVKFNVGGLTQVEINKNGAKIKTNKGSIKVQVQGVLVKDSHGKFESSAFVIINCSGFITSIEEGMYSKQKLINLLVPFITMSNSTNLLQSLPCSSISE